METYKSKKQKIIELCDSLEFPVFFPDEIEQHQNGIVLKRSDGYQLSYTVSVVPKLINDSSLIELETKIVGTGIKYNLNNTDSF